MNFDFLMQHLLKTSMVALLALASQTAMADNEGNAPHETERETQGITFESKNTDSKLLQTMKPTINFGGYIIAKYSISDRSGQATNGGFDLRFVRLYADGHVFNDFYYKFQLEVNGAPGVDKGPRVVDAFMEWQKFDFFRVKLGQFKRPFGFENPYSPLKVGYGCYSQATMKIASIGDRNGEHKRSGRALGVQIQGDLLPGAD